MTTEKKIHHLNSIIRINTQSDFMSFYGITQIIIRIVDGETLNEFGPKASFGMLKRKYSDTQIEIKQKITQNVIQEKSNLLYSSHLNRSVRERLSKAICLAQCIEFHISISFVEIANAKRRVKRKERERKKREMDHNKIVTKPHKLCQTKL